MKRTNNWICYDPKAEIYNSTIRMFSKKCKKRFKGHRLKLGNVGTGMGLILILRDKNK